MPDFTPAPCSTATSAPSAISFLTVSGVAATRGSPASVSAATAIFMTAPMAVRASGAPRRRAHAGRRQRSGQEISHETEEDNVEDDAPLHQREEALIHALVLGVVVALGGGIFNLTMRGHRAILSIQQSGWIKRLAESPDTGNAAGASSYG